MQSVASSSTSAARSVLTLEASSNFTRLRACLWAYHWSVSSLPLKSSVLSKPLTKRRPTYDAARKLEDSRIQVISAAGSVLPRLLWFSESCSPPHSGWCGISDFIKGNQSWFCRLHMCASAFPGTKARNQRNQSCSRYSTILREVVKRPCPTTSIQRIFRTMLATNLHWNTYRTRREIRKAH